MNEETTRRIAATLAELHRVFPLMRFGQLVVTVAQSARGPEVDAVYEVDDEEFLQAAQRLLERRRHQETADEPAAKVKRAV